VSWPQALVGVAALFTLGSIVYLITGAAMSGDVDAGKLAALVGVAGTVATAVGTVTGFFLGKSTGGGG